MQLCELLYGLSARFFYTGIPLPCLHRPEDFLPPEQIESHLPEENINRIPGNPGKSGAESIVESFAQLYKTRSRKVI